ncbi:hypothetical protein ASPWEDRAFT_169346 [Aspergillus wentii DTO 134E9]|uniref:Granulins domain-containing protein n=1 Tax=Aspergillus wentii DTO 134E9 TaxID=1073089 RepID=A0A1L9RX62_ASPWE|nr:uncharacterized protein ASPWEDRAFT_169346 [Aspergillus wentii DTO 134E9]OJJ39505.1 hypothetical protein ASPWEDRAFT_169346 [Aspergillus wentii DTO 134E9]
MQFRCLLLAFAAQCALSYAATETFILPDGSTAELDPSTLSKAFSPDDNGLSTRGLRGGPVSPKKLFARDCFDPNYPVVCQGGNLCCQPDDFCCEGRSCVDPDYHNCCKYGYYCNKPDVCMLNQSGGVYCQAP